MNASTPAAASGGRACARCGALFHCGRDNPGGCWCANLPPLPRAEYVDGGCLCERCLREAVAARPPAPL